MKEKTVGRFAPTPSGEMHLGNLLTAMIGYLSAKSAGGGYLLRIEDLDSARCPKKNAEDIIKRLKIFGFEFDGEIVYQSDRTRIYEKYAKELEKLGLTYPCFCTRAELHADRAPSGEDGVYVYDGKCRNLSEKEICKRKMSRKPCTRIRVPDETVTFSDLCCGPNGQNLESECGDFIIRRSDGVYAYQLAVAVDDALQGVREVVRGRDLLSSTPRQIWLMKTLGFQPPEYAHVPLLLGENGRKLSKRFGDGDTLSELMEKNSPEKIIGLLAYASGIIDKNESITLKELVPLFDMRKLKTDISIRAF